MLPPHTPVLRLRAINWYAHTSFRITAWIDCAQSSKMSAFSTFPLRFIRIPGKRESVLTDLSPMG
jgi:hypothetical protein